jgi:energy-coupling factor transporter ATP-binding protein EcfA2
MRPDVIIVDEPVAELDPLHAEQVYDKLAQINRERGTTIVAIEHHAEFVARYCRSVILMADGRLQWHLPVREALARHGELSRHGIPAPQILQAIRTIDPDAPTALTVAEAAGHLSSLGWKAQPSSRKPRPVTIVTDRVALVGGNGAGKSTLMKLLTGLKVPLEGEVEIEGINTRTVSPAIMADRVSYLHQRPEQMFLNDSIRGDISMFPSQRKRPEWQVLVDEIIERMNLTEVASRDGRMLSGGQQRRATLGVGLAMTPSLLLLDEPTSSLDLATRDAVTGLLADLSDRIRCVVVATHDMHLVAEWAHRVVVLGGGRVLRDTTPAELFDDEALMAEAQLVPPQISQLGVALGMKPPPLTVSELTARLTRPAAGASVDPPKRASA